MKINTRSILIFAGALIVAGIILAAVAYSVGGLDMGTIGNGRYQEKNFTFDADKVECLEVHDVSYNVILQGANQKDVTIKCYESPDDKFRVELNSEGRLTVERTFRNKIFNFFDFCFNVETSDIVITVPSNLEFDADLTTTSGKVRVSNLEKLEKLYAKSTSGSVGVSTVNVDGDCYISSTSGRASVEGLKADGGLSLKSISGSVEAINCEVNGDVSAVSSSGRVSLESVSAKGDVNGETTSGSVRIDALKGKDIYLKSSSGSVKGTISGNADDYRVDARSTSGSVNVPHSGSGSRQLTLRSTSGSINVDIR